MVHASLFHANRIMALYIDTRFGYVTKVLVMIPHGQLSALQRLTLELAYEASSVMTLPLLAGSALRAQPIPQLSADVGMRRHACESIDSTGAFG